MNIENFDYAISRFTGDYEMMYLRSEDSSYYLYIVEEVEGRYGPQLLAVVDGMTTIFALPTIKAFSELETGCFYIITYRGEIFFDNGYTKHEYDIVQISEEEYLSKAKENFTDDKSY